VLLDAREREAVPSRIQTDERGGSRSPGSGHCGHAVEVEHPVSASFPASHVRTMRTSDEMHVLAWRRNRKKESEKTFRLFRRPT
jgi:hypothetical protein